MRKNQKESRKAKERSLPRVGERERASKETRSKGRVRRKGRISEVK